MNEYSTLSRASELKSHHQIYLTHRWNPISCQNEPGSNGNKSILLTPQSSRIICSKKLKIVVGWGYLFALSLITITSPRRSQLDVTYEVFPHYLSSYNFRINSINKYIVNIKLHGN